MNNRGILSGFMWVYRGSIPACLRGFLFPFSWLFIWFWGFSEFSKNSRWFVYKLFFDSCQLSKIKGRIFEGIHEDFHSLFYWFIGEFFVVFHKILMKYGKLIGFYLVLLIIPWNSSTLNGIQNNGNLSIFPPKLSTNQRSASEFVPSVFHNKIQNGWPQKACLFLPELNSKNKSQLK